MALHGVPNFSIENTRQGDEIHSAQVHPEGGVSVRLRDAAIAISDPCFSQPSTIYQRAVKNKQRFLPAQFAFGLWRWERRARVWR
jgi:hypothetical protein